MPGFPYVQYLMVFIAHGGYYAETPGPHQRLIRMPLRLFFRGLVFPLTEGCYFELLYIFSHNLIFKYATELLRPYGAQVITVCEIIHGKSRIG
jgi:hypothetical protein